MLSNTVGNVQWTCCQQLQPAWSHREQFPIKVPNSYFQGHYFHYIRPFWNILIVVDSTHVQLYAYFFFIFGGGAFLLLLLFVCLFLMKVEVWEAEYGRSFLTQVCWDSTLASSHHIMIKRAVSHNNQELHSLVASPWS